MNRITALIRVVRPQQWVKNAFVFLSLFFSGDLLNTDKFLVTCAVFMAFSFAASAVYCLNDIVDIAADRSHPKKRLRPLASGALSKTSGWALMTVLLLLSSATLCFAGNSFPWDVQAVIGIYLLMNVAYTLGLKRIAIVDVFIISLGFVLRILAGSFATQTPLSHWIVLMTFLLSLFLAFAKRRDDVLIYNESGVRVRRNVVRLNLPFLNAAIIVVATMTMICYIMYTVAPEVIARLGSQYVYVTSIFVLMGILRYLQRVLVDDASGSPTHVLLTDRFIQLTVVAWVVSFVFIIYL